MSSKKICTLLLLCFCAIHLKAQEANVPKKEFRGAWMATVVNLDWPESANWTVQMQQSDLITKLNKLKKAGINAVIFQIRTEGDALYDSDIEPWSKYLTDNEGTAPDPYWDPLEFVVREAHKRGMELHAWLNPYRAMRTIPGDFTQKSISDYGEIDESLKPFLDKYYDANNERKAKGTTARDSMHVSNTHPEWLLVLNGKIAIMNPGIPEVMEYDLSVVMDVVNRYDIDGIHFDDYFYPYPPNQMSGSSANNALDDSTFIKYPRGFTNKAEWRRNNVDMLIEMVHDSIEVVKPWVKFGISPFGIWKSGTPSGIVGLNAYSVIYADGVAWLEAQTIDYVTPQLYWEFGGGQDYGKLSKWWGERAAENGRHIYPGHGLYRTDRSTFSNDLFSAGEMPRQIRQNRQDENISGSVFFRAKNITNYSSKGFKDSLETHYYKYAALQPTMDWNDMTAPDTPENLVVNRDAEKEWIFNLSWDKPDEDPVAKSTSGPVDSLIKYAVYRVDATVDPDESEEMNHYYNLIAVTGETTFTDIAPPSEGNYWYFVTTASRNNVESVPTASVDAGMVVSNEEPLQVPEQVSLAQNYPNPFNPTTKITFKLGQNGFTSLKVYDMLGREVATLANQRMVAGTHTVNFDASNFSSGIYIYQLKVGEFSLTKRMTLIK